MQMQALRRYRDIAARVAKRERSHWLAVLLRMVAIRARFGLSASEYGVYELHRKSWRQIGGFLTKKQATALYERLNASSANHLADDKFVFWERCAALCLPAAKVLAVLGTDTAIDGAEEPVKLRDFDALMTRTELWSIGKLVLKPRSDSLGTGVRVIGRVDGHWVDINDQPIDIDRFRRELQHDMQRDNYLVQPLLISHPALSRLGAGRALGTLRVVTLRSDRQIDIVYALLRIPGGRGPTDNFLGGAGGNLIAAVDLDQGVIGVARGRGADVGEDWLSPHSINPATGEPVTGRNVPCWSEVRALVLRAAAAFPELALMGWDVAVLETGPCLIEVNRNPDVTGVQATMGRGIRALLEAPIRSPVLGEMGAGVSP